MFAYLRNDWTVSSVSSDCINITNTFICFVKIMGKNSMIMDPDMTLQRTNRIIFSRNLKVCRFL